MDELNEETYEPDYEWSPASFQIKRYKPAHYSKNPKPTIPLENRYIEISDGRVLSRQQLERFICDNIHAARCAKCGELVGQKDQENKKLGTAVKMTINEGDRILVHKTCQEAFRLEQTGLVSAEALDLVTPA